MGHKSGFLSVFIVIAVAAAITAGGVVFVLQKRNMMPNEIHETQESSDKMAIAEVSSKDNHAEEVKLGATPSPAVPARLPKKEEKAMPPLASPPPTTPQPARQAVGLFGQQCEGTGYKKLNTFPLDPQNIELIVPMGRVQDSHVTPTDHQYIIPIGTVSGSLVTDNPRKYPIKAPADGYIIAIELFREPVEAAYRSQEYRDNYLVLFEHSCAFYTRLIHIDTLSERVLASFTFKNPEDQHPYASVRIPIKEGEVIGTIGSHSFDFQIMNADARDKNILRPDHIDFFSAYTVDTFDYLAEPLRTELLKKNMKKTPPIGGRIGYDVAGTLAGNWFLKGRSTAREEYWTNNMSIVSDHLDPSQIRVSLGNFGGYPKAYGVRGNAPDPASVTTQSGIVAYELVKFDYYAGTQKWDGLHYANAVAAQNTAESAGTVLFQLLDADTLKMEAFPGKSSAQATTFTLAALLYER
ncbi:MAG: hypothetical protein A3B34_03375 [Candidatus Sungbacteria bacterium RIFCSPLOWO2_01_FULL_54_21]|uniref:Uncharacterized protein n=1 Tax=Candidatus Sungbacteria bacterium RIFCSPLOWO2_01_FULL_54_21 TaxID=1802279 RepID=A0A1G2L5C9_9BACT|nr:MAG: hypothetical protein A2679_00495 [Candidatus Sungbacteria bacterium RIFCSPHIGHO2_01_FULL_54_26]OHA06770.1 MAG: hypothetical protein A3B34_03375 [Candidatus Sungbacteria bacterium RIFCSPLOWO2_01_FULL_54_21]